MNRFPNRHHMMGNNDLHFCKNPRHTEPTHKAKREDTKELQTNEFLCWTRNQS
jgi:hypothetical protein